MSTFEQFNLPKSVQKAIDDWRNDWISQDTDDYLSHYSKKFFYSDGGFQKWADYKRGIQATKPKVANEIEDISNLNYFLRENKKFFEA